MNLNDNPSNLIKEEQEILDKLISRLIKVKDKFENQIKDYDDEIDNADISINTDSYLSQIMAQRGLKDTKANRKKILNALDELYNTRLLVQYKNEKGTGIKEIKVGVHSYIYKSNEYVLSWKMPICRHFVLDNASTQFKSIVKDKYGEYRTNYKLLAKNKVNIRFDKVKKALNVYPEIVNEKIISIIRESGFLSNAFLDALIQERELDDNNEEIEKIIYDEFLQNLLERRTNSEFKNIIFSIQKKQGEIIQIPFEKNIIVQGCAGSGKSMIMLHRLPIILYDNPNSLNKTNLYIITPSPMYIQLAEKMRYQLEISDIKMGTIEQYYDYCIAKYPEAKGNEYGKINYKLKINSNDEKYVYSQKCIEDIIDFYESIKISNILLDEAYSVLLIKENTNRQNETYYQKINNKLLELQNIININNKVLEKYFKKIWFCLDSLDSLKSTLTKIKNEEKLKDKTEEKIILLDNMIERVVSTKIIFEDLKNQYSKNSVKNIYEAIDRIGLLIGNVYAIKWDVSRSIDNFIEYRSKINKNLKDVEQRISELQRLSEKYIGLDYFNLIIQENNNLSIANNTAVKNAYALVMNNIGIKASKKGNISAVKCSPYIYLQALYQYRGEPPAKAESLLAIDEAQGLAIEEIKLLKNINGSKVIFNMYGDVNQHIERTKGIDDWNELKDIIVSDCFDIKENYRNASQITEYCNNVFGMSMSPINVEGRGVHVFETMEDFENEIITQLLIAKKEGLSAILVANDDEAKTLLKIFSNYKDKFHDMTSQERSLHKSKWNIMNIEDAKGLEFNSVVVLTDCMSRNEQYIAFTRALDELFVYHGVLDYSE